MSLTLNRAQQAELSALLSQHRGVLHPRQIVEVARDASSSLHQLIGWDRDADELADRYRLERARLVLAALKLRADEETQRQTGRIRDEAERQRLNGILAEMKRRESRKLIHYSDDREGGYRDVVRELVEGRESSILAQLVKELEGWVSSRATLHPRFHDHMLRVVETVNRTFLANPNEEN